MLIDVYEPSQKVFIQEKVKHTLKHMDTSLFLIDCWLWRRSRGEPASEGQSSTAGGASDKGLISWGGI